MGQVVKKNSVIDLGIHNYLKKLPFCYFFK